MAPRRTTESGIILDPNGEACSDIRGYKRGTDIKSNVDDPVTETPFGTASLTWYHKHAGHNEQVAWVCWCVDFKSVRDQPNKASNALCKVGIRLCEATKDTACLCISADAARGVLHPVRELHYREVFVDRNTPQKHRL